MAALVLLAAAAGAGGVAPDFGLFADDWLAHGSALAAAAARAAQLRGLAGDAGRDRLAAAKAHVGGVLVNRVDVT